MDRTSPATIPSPIDKWVKRRLGEIKPDSAPAARPDKAKSGSKMSFLTVNDIVRKRDGKSKYRNLYNFRIKATSI